MIIDILLSTYNGEKYIHNLIDSIINQSYTEWRLYIRDDGSIDDTSNILNWYKEKYLLKIKIIEDNLGNIGPSKSFMELIKYSNADYFMFCDQDDVWFTNKIKITLDKMLAVKQNNEGIPIIIHTDLTVVDSELNIISKSFWKYQNKNPNIKNYRRLIVENNITGCTMMLSKEIKKYINLEKNDFILMHDWFTTILAAYYGVIDYVDTSTIFYRQHNDNVLGAKSILSKIKNYRFNLFRFIKERKNNYDKYTLQSNVLYKVTKEDKILKFCQISRRNIIYKMFWCIKYGFYKHSFIGNIIFFIFYSNHNEFKN
ncbi:MAG: glycosyltransferase family 2 protein [Fusobacteriaceae bacterium]|jgi:glycosyltransferase involved in cell wall biosynthesis|nr:glycosyltransferase family 2 protein [Fusobacteriaceae bacterium]